MDGSDSSAPHRISLPRSAWRWYTDVVEREGRLAATRQLLNAVWDFVRDSTPERRRQRYGDAEFDWDHRVNTTSSLSADRIGSVPRNDRGPAPGESV